MFHDNLTMKCLKGEHTFCRIHIRVRDNMHESQDGSNLMVCIEGTDDYK
jgi:hypothetical protein